MADFRQPATRSGFKIAIICALTRERDAVMEMLDQTWDHSAYGKAPADTNTYRFGRIGSHNVVVAQLPNMAIEASASTAASFRSSFLDIRLGLVVGICGGVPTRTPSGDILMGDVIISKHIVDFTYGRKYDNKHEIKDTLADSYGRQNKEIRSFLVTMEGKRDRETLKKQSLKYLTILCSKDIFASSRFPGADKDILYERTYRHKHQQPQRDDDDYIKCNEAEGELEKAKSSSNSRTEPQKLMDEVKNARVCTASEKKSCEELQCDRMKAVQRNPRRDSLVVDEPQMTIRMPEIHFGTYGSGNSVLKSGFDRDKLAETHDIIAFEMEGAGAWDNFPTVVIKAVCDYADSHKNKEWQDFAAASAAACMKAFLMQWTVADDALPDKTEARK